MTQPQTPLDVLHRDLRDARQRAALLHPGRAFANLLADIFRTEAEINRLVGERAHTPQFFANPIAGTRRAPRRNTPAKTNQAPTSGAT